MQGSYLHSRTGWPFTVRELCEQPVGRVSGRGVNQRTMCGSPAELQGEAGGEDRDEPHAHAHAPPRRSRYAAVVTAFRAPTIVYV